MIRLACVEWPVTAVQRPIDSSILKRQVTAAADIQACLVTGCNQPQTVDQTPIEISTHG